MSGERQAGNPIPWTAIRQYYDREGFGRFSDFHRVIKAVDRAYLEAVEARYADQRGDK